MSRQEGKAITGETSSQPPPYSTLPPAGHAIGSKPSPPGFTVQQPAVTIVPPAVQMGQSVTYVLGFGPHPKQMNCTSCNQPILTQTRPAIGLLTWIISGALVFVGCWFGCCLIPCCVPECQDIEHWCPNCNRHLGTYKRL